MLVGCSTALRLVAAASLALVGCDASPASQPVAHDFPELQAAPGEERNFVCQSWTLRNEQPIYVNKVSMVAGRGWHHSNWLYVPETSYPGPDDTWNCADRGYVLIDAAVRGGVFYTQSPEVQSETQAFNPGVAVVIPPHSKIVVELHLLNAAPTELSTHVHLEFDTLPPDSAQVKLAPLGFSYYPLALPPHAASAFGADCDLAANLDFNIYSLTAHYHALGTGMRVEAYDHAGNGSLVYETSHRTGESLASVFATPFHVEGAEGIRFTCQYENPSDSTVGYGPSAATEMCVLYGFTDSDTRWLGSVPASPASVSLGTDTAHVQRFTGKCGVIALPRQ
jgi:hypothetical protein